MWCLLSPGSDGQFRHQLEPHLLLSSSSCGIALLLHTLILVFFFFLWLSGSCTLHSSSTRSISRCEPIPDDSLLSGGANKADICVHRYGSSGWTPGEPRLTVICEGERGVLVTLAWKTYLVSLRASKGYHRDGSGWRESGLPWRWANVRGM